MAADRKPARHRRDRLKQLRAFCHAARLRSISQAAERIYSSQPAVSQQVRTLEEDLGTTLFERSGPRIALTPAGDRLYRLAMPLVEGVDRLPDTFTEQHRGVASGDLDIAAGQTTAAFALPGYLKRFQERHPGVRVNVKIGDGRQRVEWLRAYEVDVALVAVDIPPPDLEFRPVFSYSNVLITPEDHPLAGREWVELGEVAAYPSVQHTSGRYISEVGRMILRQHGLAANVVVEVDGWNVIKLYVAAGIGIAVVPDLCLTDRDRVWRLPYTKYFPPRAYGVLTRRDDILSLAATWFMRIVESGES